MKLVAEQNIQQMSDYVVTMHRTKQLRRLGRTKGEKESNKIRLNTHSLSRGQTMSQKTGMLRRLRTQLNSNLKHPTIPLPDQLVLPTTIQTV
jgi:hypothetical protein